MNIVRQVKLANVETPEHTLEITIGVLNDHDAEYGYFCKLITQEGESNTERFLSEARCSLEQAETAFLEFVAEQLTAGYEEFYDDEDVDDHGGGESFASFQAAGDRVVDMRERLRIAATSGKEQELCRLLWRVGEQQLTALVEDVAEFIVENNTIRNYIISWTLGRLAENRSYSVLAKLYKQNSSPMVQAMAFAAMLLTATKKQRMTLITQLIGELPESLSAALRSDRSDGDAKNLAEQIHALIATRGLGIPKIFFDLYLLTEEFVFLKGILLSAVAKVPLTPNYLKALRQLFKMAKLRMDADMFALILFRFETTPSPYGRNAWEFEYVRLPGAYDYVHFEDEISKADSRLAYSAKSRDYLRWTGWRFLSKIRQYQPDRYAEFASAVLMPFKDEHGTQARHSKVKDWRPDDNGEWKQVVVAEKKFGPFSGYCAFNHILYQNSKRFVVTASGRAWSDFGEEPVTKEVTDDEPKVHSASENIESYGRTEAWPDLWDQHPARLLALLQHSACEPVHVFATRALYDNKDFCATLDLHQPNFTTLISSSYSVTAQFALALIQERYVTECPEPLITQLLHSRYAPARVHALAVLAPTVLENNSSNSAIAGEQYFNLLINTHADVRAWARQKLSQSPPGREERLRLINSLFDFLLALKDEVEPSRSIAVDISAVLITVFAEQLKTVEMKLIEQVLYHPLSIVQAVAGEIMIYHSVPAEFLPAKVFHALIESKAANVREVGLRLFKQLPKPVLVRQAEMLVAFCLSEHDTIRATVRPVLKPLVNESEELGNKLATLFVQRLLQTARYGHWIEDIVTIMTRDLEKNIYSLDSDSVWCLLQSERRDVQQYLGIKLLSGCAPSAFSVSQWVVLASHNLLEVRRWSYDAFEKNVALVKQHAAEAVGILESDWLETRQFAMRYFLNYFSRADWSPDILIRVCENKRFEVQKFGSELILDFFNEGQGLEYLMKLSQHPALFIQEFVGNLLDRYAAGSLSRLQALWPYFRSVLTRLRLGRKLKNKILNFLHVQAKADIDITAWLLPLLVELSNLEISQERERMLEIAVDLSLCHPQVASPLVVLGHKTLAYKTETSDGV